jgi:hypothetical protein
MTSIESTISKINKTLISTFALFDGWFDQPRDFLHSKSDLRWGPLQILEHVMLTNHYLLLLIEKGADKAVRKAKGVDLNELVSDYTFDHSRLNNINDPSAFPWHRPEHMEPSGNLSLNDIRDELRDQLYRCLCIVEKLQRGEGVLHTVTLSVNNIGKLDLYQYLYFLVLHMQRHLPQLDAVRKAYAGEKCIEDSAG